MIQSKNTTSEQMLQSFQQNPLHLWEISGKKNDYLVKISTTYNDQKFHRRGRSIVPPTL
jgi:hypothetical protein